MTLTPQQIATATKCPLQNVEAHWPLIVSALWEQGIRSDLVEVAAAATIAVETANTFLPIKERIAKPERQPELFVQQQRYTPFTGRGFVQITWRRNYEAAGEALGLNLISNPDLALEPEASARILAWFFKTNRIHHAADAMEWRRVRQKVNGGFNGWEEFWMYVCRLLEVSREPDMAA